MRPLALTLGEPAGIGPELTLALWAKRKALGVPAFIAVGDPALLASRARLLQLDVPLAECTAEEAPARFASALPVFPTGPAATASPGKARSHQRRRRPRRDRARRRTRGRGKSRRHRHQPDCEIRALRGRIRISGTHRIPRASRGETRRSGAASGHDDLVRGARGRAGDHSRAPEGSAGAVEHRSHRRDGPDRRARTHAALRHRAPASCRLRAQSACRRRGSPWPGRGSRSSGRRSRASCRKESPPAGRTPPTRSFIRRRASATTW